MKHTQYFLLSLIWGFPILASDTSSDSELETTPTASEKFVILCCNLAKKDPEFMKGKEWMSYTWVVTARSSPSKIIEHVFNEQLAEQSDPIDVEFLCRTTGPSTGHTFRPLKHYPDKENKIKEEFTKTGLFKTLNDIDKPFYKLFTEKPKVKKKQQAIDYKDCLLTKEQVEKFFTEGMLCLKGENLMTYAKKRLQFVDVLSFLQEDLRGHACLDQGAEGVMYTTFKQLGINVPKNQTIKATEKCLQALNNNIDSSSSEDDVVIGEEDNMDTTAPPPPSFSATPIVTTATLAGAGLLYRQYNKNNNQTKPTK